MITDYITPGVIITVLILLTISIWLLIGRLWQRKVIDNAIVREKVFKFISDFSLYLVSNGNNKTKAVYFKSYMSLLLIMKPEIQDELERYNKEIIENIKSASREKINTSTIDLINAFRKAYKIEKEITKLWIADLKEKSVEKV